MKLQSSYAEDDTTTKQGLQRSSSRQAFRESLTMDTIGYVYHPDLLLFTMAGTYGEDQQQTETNNSSASTQGDFDAYDVRGIFFRKKPYTLDFFSEKEKTFNTSLVGENNDITRESGAKFKYRKEQYDARINYKNTNRFTTDRSALTEDYDSYLNMLRPKLGVLDRFLVNALARYQIQDEGVTGTVGGRTKTTTQQGALTNAFGYSRFNFSTGLNATNLETDSGSFAGVGYTSDQIGFNENINADLPWDLTSRVGLSMNRANSHSDALLFGSDPLAFVSQSGESTSNHKQINYTLTHELFDSLRTEFKAKSDSLDTSRSDALTELTGTVVSQDPREETSQNDDVSFTSDYQKQLPQNSLLTGALSLQDNRIVRDQLSAEPQLVPFVEENGGIIQLDKATDTNAPIIVEVLQNNNTCTAAVDNPRIPSPCWIPLRQNEDYRSAVGSPFQIEILRLSDGHVDLANGYSANLDYLSFPQNEISGNFIFTFRITTFLVATDAKTRGSAYAVGLNLFNNLVSSRYRHQLTEQEGTYGDFQLSPKVTDDEAFLGFAKRPFTAGVTQRWLEAENQQNQTSTLYQTSYSDSRVFYELITTSFGAEWHKGVANTEDDSGRNSESTLDGYGYGVDLAMPVRYIDAALKATHHYTYTNGEILTLTQSGEGPIIPTQSLGIGERTVIRNTIGLNKPFRIPLIDFVANTFVRYETEAESGQYTIDRSVFAYGVNAMRGWQLGATNINLRGSYAVKEDSYTSESSTSLRGLERDEQNDKTSIVLTIVRQLR